MGQWADGRGANSGWAARHGRDVLLISGLAMAFSSLIGGFLDPGNKTTYLGLAAGVFMVVLACVGSLIRKFKGPGFELEARDLAELEVSTGLAAGESPATPVPSVVSDDLDDILGTVRWLLASDALERWLHHPSRALEGCRLHLYLFDPAQDLLVPAFESDAVPTAAEAWKPGFGAVGTAWSRGGLIVITGAACRDATYGLSPEQQKRYASLAAVAATPVLNAAGKPLGVLAAATEDPASRLPTEDGQLELVALTEFIARILVDVLKWFTDQDDA